MTSGTVPLLRFSVKSIIRHFMSGSVLNWNCCTIHLLFLICYTVILSDAPPILLKCLNYFFCKSDQYVLLQIRVITPIQNVLFFKLQLGVFMYRYFNRYLSDNFGNYFFLNSDVHSHYARSSNLCLLLSYTVTLRSFNISITGPTFWNTLPSHVKSCLTLSSFKLKLKMLLLN